jgi:hypothetical protein
LRIASDGTAVPVVTAWKPCQRFIGREQPTAALVEKLRRLSIAGPDLCDVNHSAALPFHAASRPDNLRFYSSVLAVRLILLFLGGPIRQVKLGVPRTEFAVIAIGRIDQGDGRRRHAGGQHVAELLQRDLQFGLECHILENAGRGPPIRVIRPVPRRLTNTWGAYQPSDRAEARDSVKIRAATIHRLYSPSSFGWSLVVLWNTLQIERIVEQLRAGSTAIRDEDFAHF